jgi:branched-chain amino acid transport system ATP-binding protein
MSAILSVEGIHTFIGQFQILEGVTVAVPENSITVLLGRNGAGKTTTLRSIIGLTPPSKGAISYKDQDIIGRRTVDIVQLGIGYVPDHRAIFNQLTVAENLLIAERRKGDLERKRAFIFEFFPDLERLYEWPGGQLSGGQQQMLAVARVLVPDNQLLLIDEPMMRAIQQLSDQTTVLLVEQNFQVARLLADRYVIIENGKSVHSGSIEDLIEDSALVSRYLGAV